MPFESVIGLEVHAELLTQSKMFCGCAVVDSTTAEPNRHVCPVCTGQPGALPVVNKRAVEFAIRVGLALNCAVNRVSVFARKNYFYPDLPKGYQISQYELPLASNGWILIDTPDGAKKIRVRRVHLEEDTGKLTHADGYSLVDLNRAGVPLLEIVSEPDLRSVEDVKAYAAKLRTILRYLGVNNGDMEKGVIRFEANVSVRETGTEALNTRTEIKNLNSFRALVNASAYEIARQIKVYERGGAVAQETLGWNEASGKTVSQRSKEHAHDYRYFPEPDIPPLELDPAWVEEIRSNLAELPDAKRERFLAFGLTPYDAGVMVAESHVADYFDEAAKFAQSLKIEPKAVANWILSQLFGLLNESGQEIDQCRATPERLVGLIKMVADGVININTGKSVLSEMFVGGQSAEEIVRAKGLAQVSDESAIVAAIEKAIADNPDQLAAYLGGKETLAKWFFGQVMRAMGGKANPAVIQKKLDEKFVELKRG
ncbi:MAG: Asp-tRNA(Asn)/Glu-tRNA(Gln) amidotransferase subunit GatB [Chloroflexi bacterium]|nr:Asp-tRNA(Asn)/Glu-tRNA(Gln) amidotransferase subunit GatB [Chloroflexota bacterium]